LVTVASAFSLPPGAVPADDPLPRRRLLTSPPLGGTVKERAGDFLVEEQPLYEPSGEGEHLYLGVQKQDMPHSEMIEVLADHFGVSEAAIGFAGMKDKVAVTRQTVSIHLPGVEATPKALEHERLTVLWAKRHGNKLRRGHLAGNRFAIRVRKLDPLKAVEVWRALGLLERTGIPDYFGSQRFGYRRNTHRLGKHLLNRDWDALLHELLGLSSPSPERQHRRRELFVAGQFAESLPHWGRNDRAERIALSALAAGRSPEQAVRAVPDHVKAFWVSAFQSAVFNRVLDRRIEAGLLAEMVEGDVAFKHVTRGQFVVTPEIRADPAFATRAASFEISPSGPMLGTDMLEPTGEVLAWEREAAESLGVDPAALADRERGTPGTRRPLRVPVTDIELDSGFDEQGTYVRLAFDLPRGAYATVLLREVLGDEAAPEPDHAG
jgi:tRNA pseudouridine13 synthase